MLFSRQLSAAECAALFRRVAVALEAGLDLRRTWTREADAAHGRSAVALAAVRDGVAAGQTLAEAMSAAGAAFSPLALELVKVGEETGRLPEMFRQLADHYEHAARWRRDLARSSMLPALQFAAVLVVFAAVIFVGGIIGPRPVDVLGWGLVGAWGLVQYVVILAVLVGGGIALWKWLQGRVRSGAAESVLARLPIVGPLLEQLALARLTKLLQLTTASGLSMQRVIELALGGSGSKRLAAAAGDVWQRIRAGDNLHAALATTGLLPVEYLAAVEVGEESGRLPQTMAALARQYQEQARGRLQILARLAGWAIWLPMALLVINRVMAIYGGYVNAIHDAVGR